MLSEAKHLCSSVIRSWETRFFGFASE
jgi:hypothetical protein